MMYPCLYTVLINLEFLKMNKLTSLHSECLANMPMMLDVMTNTVEALSELLNPQYDRIEEYLTEFFDKHKKLRCQLDESWERGTVYAFTDHVTRYKKRYLLELMPALELYYCIPFSKTTKNSVSFSVEFGYTADETQNVVYFGLGEMNSAQYLTDAWIEKIKTESRGRLGDLYGRRLYRISDNARRSTDGRKDRPLRGRFHKPHPETSIGTITINLIFFKIKNL